MLPSEVPAELVEKAEAAASLLPGAVLGEPITAALHVVAAVLPDIQAQTLEEAARHFDAKVYEDFGIPGASKTGGDIRRYAARLTEESTT